MTTKKYLQEKVLKLLDRTPRTDVVGTELAIRIRQTIYDYNATLPVDLQAPLSGTDRFGVLTLPSMRPTSDKWRDRILLYVDCDYPNVLDGIASGVVPSHTAHFENRSFLIVSVVAPLAYSNAPEQSSSPLPCSEQEHLQYDRHSLKYQ